MTAITTTNSELSVFVTLESFGLNSTYRDCDGIPRLAFLAPPTRTVTRRVDVLSMFTGSYWKFLPLPPPTSAPAYSTTSMREPEKPTTLQKPTTPSCTLEERQCQEMQAFWEGEYGANPDPRILSIHSDRFQGVRPFGVIPCKQYQGCRMEMGDEIVLLYWPPTVTSRDICALDGHGSAQTIEQPQNSEVIATTNVITFRGKDLYHMTYCSINGEPECIGEAKYFTGSNLTN